MRHNLEQKHAAKVLADQQRFRLSAARARLREGPTTIRDLLQEDPELLARFPVWEILPWQRGCGATRMIDLNKQAIRDRVNLAVPVGRMTPSSFQWLLDNLPGAQRPTKPAVPSFEPLRVPCQPFREAYTANRVAGEDPVGLAARCGFGDTSEAHAKLYVRSTMPIATARRLAVALDVAVTWGACLEEAA